MTGMKYFDTAHVRLATPRASRKFAPKCVVPSIVVAIYAVAALSTIARAADPLPEEREAVLALQRHNATGFEFHASGHVRRLYLVDQDLESLWPNISDDELPEMRKQLDTLRKLESVWVYFSLRQDVAPEIEALAGMPTLKGVGVWAPYDSAIEPRHFERLASGGNLARVDAFGLEMKKYLPAIVANEALEELTFGGPADDEVLEIVSQIKGLRRLEIIQPDAFPFVKRKGPFVTDEGLASLSRLKHIERLALPFASITDRGADELSKLAALTHLELCGGKLGEKGICAIGRLANLRELKLSEMNIDDEGAKYLRELSQLESLSLYRNPVTDRGIDELRSLKQLRKLSVSLTQVTEPRLAKLKRDLPLLDDARSGVPDGVDPASAYLVWKKRGMFNINDGRATMVWSFSGSDGEPDWPLTHDDVVSLKKMDALESLIVSHASIDDRTMKVIGGWRALKALGLGGTSVTDAGLKEISELRRLTQLNLSATKVTDAGMAQVASFRELDTLRLEGAAITDAGIAQLVDLPKLRMVHLRNTKITDVSLKTLAAMPSVEYMEVDGTGVTPEAVEGVRKSRPNLRIPRGR